MMEDLITKYVNTMPTGVGLGPLTGPRMRFQWNCVVDAEGPILNVGSCDDPLNFGDRVTHLDYDDWSEYFKAKGAPFVQGDAHHLVEMFGEKAFDLVVLGDVLEHVVDPHTVLRNCCRVSRRAICLTIWEEWRCPGAGQWPDVAQEVAKQEARKHGFEDYYDYYDSVHPVKTRRDQLHLGHINQFTDQDASKWVQLIRDEGFEVLVGGKVKEVVHEGHDAYNWLIYAVRSVRNE